MRKSLDAVVYTTVLTLVIFLLFRIPKIWQGVDYAKADSNDKTGKMAGVATLLVTGLLTLTVQYWAGPSHTWGGTNWAAAFSVTTWMLGLGQLLGGMALFITREKAEITASRPEVRV